MQFDFQEVALADESGFELRLADVDFLLEAFQVFLGKLKCGFGEQDADELLRNVEDERTLGVSDLGTGDGGSVPGCSQAMLALLAALEQIA